MENWQERYPLQMSTDLAGLGDPWYAYSIYKEAGYRNFAMEGVAFPWMIVDLLMKDNRCKPLQYPLVAIHGFTNQLAKGGWMKNSPADVVKLLVADNIMPRVEYEDELNFLGALDRLGMPGRKRFLVHDTVLNSDKTICRYAEVFSRPEFANIDLFIELSPLPGSAKRVNILKKKMCDAGLPNVKIASDSVHYLRSHGVALNDKWEMLKIWPRFLKWTEKSDARLLHFSLGKDMGDSHRVKGMIKEASMLRDLAELLRAQKIDFELENQHGPFGPADYWDEVDRLRWIGEKFVGLGLISEKNFM